MKSNVTSILCTTMIAALVATTAQAQDGGGGRKRPHSEPDLSKLPPAAKKAGVTYAKDVRPLLEASCFRCHGEEKQKGDLRLDTLEGVLKGGEDGKVVTAGDSAKSPLVVAVAQIDDETAMPPKRRGRGPGRAGGPGGPRGPGGPGGPGDFGPPPGAQGAAGAPPPQPPQNGSGPGEAAKPGTAGAPGKPGTDPQAQPFPPRGGFGGPGGNGGPGGFGGPGGPGGPMAKPLTAEQVGVIRAWIDQGAK